MQAHETTPEPTVHRTAPEVQEVAAALWISIGLLKRQLRLATVAGDLTLPETSALTRLERGGPTTVTKLARLEQISPQSMGATLAGLEARGHIDREPDPHDGRRALLSITSNGSAALRERRAARTDQLAHALTDGFSRDDLRKLLDAAPLLERLAHSL